MKKPLFRIRNVLLTIAAGGVLAVVGARMTVFRPNLNAVERGRRIAERSGCFACHGPDGTRGAANPGRSDRTVPNFEAELGMYARNPGEIREWIRDGVTADQAKRPSWRRERDRGALKMPAFRDRLSTRQIDDLVAFVLAVSGEPTPEPLQAQLGRKRAEGLGCIGCHGAGGRFERPNPGSLKGYVPSWDGADFPELVRSREEFGEWIEHGVSRRFERNPVAQFFLKRAPLKMPAYRDHLRPGDVDNLWAYVTWLRYRTTRVSG